jgi:hypothetical protein
MVGQGMGSGCVDGVPSGIPAGLPIDAHAMEGIPTGIHGPHHNHDQMTLGAGEGPVIHLEC